MATDSEIFRRNELLLGAEAMERLAQKRVIIFGVGGVGSWCAEGLVRSGIRRLTIVDSDRVCATNINRQLMATTLARALRNKFKKSKQFPKRKFQCVYSDELLQNRGEQVATDIAECVFPKAQVNGSIVHITAVFSFMLAGLVVRDATSA